MELVASLPPDLAASADPAARAAAPPLRSSRQDDAAAAASAPFDLLLALLTVPMPTGESLPAAGKALPAASATAAAAATDDGTVTTDGAAKPVTPPSPGASGTDLLARLKLSLAPAEPVAPAAAETLPPVDGADTQGATVAKLVDPDLPVQVPPVAGRPPPSAPPPAATATATAAVAAAPVPPAPEVAAALEAAVPQAGGVEPAPKLARTGTARDPDPGSVAASPATAATDLRASPAGQGAAPTPIGELADTLARPAHRDSIVDVLPSPGAPAPVDSTPPPAAAPAHGPGLAHPTGTASPAASAPAAAGPGAPLDTRADHWHEALASRVQVLVDQHVGEARIKLSPPELGSLDVKISLVEDKTFVQLTAGTAAARDELAQSLPRLRDLFSASGLSLGGATVQGGWGGQAGEAGRDASPRSASPAFSPFAAVADQELEPVRAATRAAGRIDLFA